MSVCVCVCALELGWVMHGLARVSGMRMYGENVAEKITNFNLQHKFCALHTYYCHPM